MAKYPNKPGDWKNFEVKETKHELLIGDWQVMHDWEQPIMQKLAKNIAGPDKRVLEVGFGMGISAEAIFQVGCSDYTVIEAHPVVAQKARDWLASKNRKGTVVEGLWQEVVGSLPKNSFDGILFDTYPLTPSERGVAVYDFLPKAKQLLSSSGVLTYYSGERSDFRSEHIKLLFSNYEKVCFERVSGLAPPKDCEYWNDNYMIIPTVSKPIPLPEDNKPFPALYNEKR